MQEATRLSYDGSGCSSSATVTVGSAPSAVSVNVTSTDQTDATNPDGVQVHLPLEVHHLIPIYGVMEVLMP